MTRLQAHIKRLEAMIAAHPPAKERLSAPASASRRPAARADKADPPDQRTLPKAKDYYDMTAQDLGGALVSLITAGAVVPSRAGQESFLPNGQSSRGLLAECETLVASTSIIDQSEPPCTAALPDAATLNLKEMLALVPSEREMRIAYDFYRPRFASFYYSVDHDEIEVRWPRMKAILDARDAALFAAEFEPHFFALVLATCVAGLSRMPESVAKQHRIHDNCATEGVRWAKVAVLFLEVVSPPRQCGTSSRAIEPPISPGTADGLAYVGHSPGRDRLGPLLRGTPERATAQAAHT